MAEFAKAKLQRVSSDEKAEPIGDPIEVQFNPNALKLSVANATDTGKTAGRQKAQYLGTGSATLTVELTFDTADEGTTDEPKSVLDKTTPVEQLLLPQGNDAQKQSPPTVRFEWGRFILTGLVESMSVDLDLFSESGVPLRARVGLSIREQKSDFEFMKKGAGANKAGNAVAPGKAGLGAVGGIGLAAGASLSAGASLGLGLSAGISGGIGASLSAGVSLNAQTAVSIDGESAAEFAARVGMDPTAWRAVAAGQIDATLSMPPGVEIDFDVSASAAAGMGASVGPQAGIRTTIEASFGLATPPKGAVAATFSAPGFALSAAGGVAAAIETVSIAKAESAVASTRQAFGVPAVASTAASISPPRPYRPEQSRPPLKTLAAPTRRDLLPGAPPAPLADPRAVTFGAGVPLRPRVGGAAAERRRALHTVTAARRPAQVRRDPTRPPWARTPGAIAVIPDHAPHTAPCACGCGRK